MIEPHWTDRLSEYLDGDMDAADRAALEDHLARCVDCASVLGELRAVVTTAAMLEDEPPARDLWPGIQARLEPRQSAATQPAATQPVAAQPAATQPAAAPRDPDVIPIESWRRVAVGVPQLIAAGLALVVMSAAATWVALGGASGDPAPVVTAVATSPETAPASDQVVLAAFEPAMAELEAEYQARRAELDPETIRVVEENLAIIDAAIREAHEALAADPASGFLHGHLAETMRWRMDLLRQATSI